MSMLSAPRSTRTTRPSPSNGGSKTNNEAKICEGSMGRAQLLPPQPLCRLMGHRNPLHDFIRIQSKNGDQNKGTICCMNGSSCLNFLTANCSPLNRDSIFAGRGAMLSLIFLLVGGRLYG